MKSLMELADDKPKFCCEKLGKVIENRTGYPKGLLEKTREVIEGK